MSNEQPATGGGVRGRSGASEAQKTAEPLLKRRGSARLWAEITMILMASNCLVVALCYRAPLRDTVDGGHQQSNFHGLDQEEGVGPAGYWTSVDVQPRVIAFADHYIPDPKSLLPWFVDRLAAEGISKEGVAGFVVIVVETRPLTKDKKAGTVQVTCRGEGDLAGYCFRRHGEMVEEHHQRLYQSMGISRVFLPPSKTGDYLMLILRVSAPPKRLPKTSKDLFEFLEMKVVDQ
jgi:hypothetical protein